MSTVHMIPDPGPVERLLSDGARSLNDDELVAILLGTGSRNRNVHQLSADLVGDFGSIARLAMSSPHSWARREGIGPTKSARLAAALELGRRALLPPPQTRPVRGPAELVGRTRVLLGARGREAAVLALLDARLCLIDLRVVSEGSVASVFLYPRALIGLGLERDAAAMVLLHNHPSGDPAPSDRDLSVTHELARLGRALDLPLLDHIILGSRGFHSMREAGTLEIPEPSRIM
jgi:DNA repair protein RadC